MPKCISAPNELTPDTHLSMSSERAWRPHDDQEGYCSEHNNAFGGTMIQALAAQVEIFATPQLQSGRKKPPPPLKNPDGCSEKISIAAMAFFG